MTPPPRARPVVLDTRVVTGAGGGPDKTILNSPRFLEPLHYHMLCGYLHPPGDPGFEVLRRKADQAAAPLIAIPDRGPWDWRVIRELLAVCRREKVQIWHGHDYKTNALGLLLKRFWPMRLVTTVHGWVKHTTRTPLYYRLDRMCLPRYERVICVSDDLLEECLACGVPPSRLSLLENGIDLVEYARTRSVEQARQELGLPADRFVIGAVGRLSPEKGFDLLLRAVPALRRQHPNLHVLIVGEGDHRPALEQLIRELGLGDCVSLPGWSSDVRLAFEAMDVFALSSYREGLPNVLLEAMALEVPVAATRVNGVPRLIQHRRNGLLVEPGDAAALAQALEELCASETLRQTFRVAGRQTVESRYSFAHRMEKLAALYDELLAS